jgi:hypothetical protein
MKTFNLPTGLSSKTSPALPAVSQLSFQCESGYALTDTQELTTFTNQAMQSPTPQLEDRTVEHRTNKSTYNQEFYRLPTPKMVTNSNTHREKNLGSQILTGKRAKGVSFRA